MLLAVVGVTWSVVCPHWWCSCRLLSRGGGAAGDTGDGVTWSRHTGPGHVTSAGHSDTPHWCGGHHCPPPAPPHRPCITWTSIPQPQITQHTLATYRHTSTQTSVPESPSVAMRPAVAGSSVPCPRPGPGVASPPAPGHRRSPTLLTCALTGETLDSNLTLCPHKPAIIVL